MLQPFDTTGIGSLPFIEPEEAVRFSINACSIPFWPQLPRRSFLEQMIPQFAEDMPGLRIDPSREVIYIDTEDTESLNRFYERLEGEEVFLLSESVAPGLYIFLKTARQRGFRVVKGQCTGPLTFTLGLKDSSGNPIYANEELRELSLLLLQRKVSWQIRQLREVAEEVLIFIDEPVLTAVGSSAYLGVAEAEVLRMISAIVEAVKSEGGIAGVHCCGKADWTLLIRTGVDIINFDSYYYFDSIVAAREALKEFLETGGYLAWGMVPTTEDIGSVEFDDLFNRFKEALSELGRFIPDELLYSRSILTPSCGAGGRDVEETEKVFRLLNQLSETIRQ